MGDVDKYHRCHVMSTLINVWDGESRCDDATTCGSYEKVEEHEFTIVIDDPARSSCIENPNALHPDPNMRCEEYERTPTHDEVLGLQPSIGAIHMGPIENHNSIENDHLPSRRHSLEIDEDRISNSRSPISQVHEEVMTFPTTCPHCQTQAETKMCMTDIPHFKEVVIMCLQCEHCGFRSNEIKGGGAIPRLGTKITLRAIDMRDLAREVLKSDTAGVSVPELDLELDDGGLGGMYTTVEGLILKMHDRLRDVHPIKTGDSSIEQQSTHAGEVCAPRHEYARYNEFLTQLKDTAMGQRFPFTLVLVDSFSNSFVGPKCGIMHFNRMCDDEGLEIEEFERTEDQNESLGLNDIRTETN
jgi:zinc finger protein